MEQIFLMLKNSQSVQEIFKQHNIKFKISTMESLHRMESLLDIGTVASALVSIKMQFNLLYNYCIFITAQEI
jgi:hypothetical protein